MFKSQVKGRQVTSTRRNFADISLPRRDDIFFPCQHFAELGWPVLAWHIPQTPWELDRVWVEHHGTHVAARSMLCLGDLQVLHAKYTVIYTVIYTYIYIYIYVFNMYVCNIYIYIHICPITTGQLRPIPPVVFPWVELADCWALQEGKDEWSVNVWNTCPFWTFQASFFHEPKDFSKSVVLVCVIIYIRMIYLVSKSISWSVFFDNLRIKKGGRRKIGELAFPFGFNRDWSMSHKLGLLDITWNSSHLVDH